MAPTRGRSGFRARRSAATALHRGSGSSSTAATSASASASTGAVRPAAATRNPRCGRTPVPKRQQARQCLPSSSAPGSELEELKPELKPGTGPESTAEEKPLGAERGGGEGRGLRLALLGRQGSTTLCAPSTPPAPDVPSVGSEFRPGGGGGGAIRTWSSGGGSGDDAAAGTIGDKAGAGSGSGGAAAPAQKRRRAKRAGAAGSGAAAADVAVDAFSGAAATAADGEAAPKAPAQEPVPSPPPPPPPPQLVAIKPRDPPNPRPPPGVRGYPDGRSASSRLSRPWRLLAQARAWADRMGQIQICRSASLEILGRTSLVTLAMYVGWPYVLLALTVAALRGSPFAWAALGVLFGSLLLPAPARPWHGFLDSGLFRLWRAYFNYSYSYEQLPDLSRPNIFVQAPHGAFPLSQILANTLGSQVFPGHPIHCLAASVLFYVPIWRHIKAWFGAAPASRDNCRHLLRNQGSVAVLAGGIAEMYVSAAGQAAGVERLLLRNRRGFVRLALEMGAPIIPVFHFGNSQVLTFGPALLQPASRRFRIAFGTVLGVLGLPVPHPQPLYMAVAKPIEVPYTRPSEPHFEELVDEYLARVVQAYQELYDKHREEYGWGQRPLEIC
ncbi:hypothetical protein HYH03_000970 [Edaphochlamys debaryana]|uniref:Acyltransferase n=1 Tax=Edaphochlamys debaryana TaxID=47281 RepID=A0A835YMC6_9CHLO|nr:hypothetical protein HYH03_000970 [Edaphochlamys debaryana]|eukprot:KAG2501155.1 hypothetical protein HYH03_000970 [Edaphochlamys debaryana]